MVGPLPPSHEFKHLLTIVDRFTRWPEAIPVNDITSQGLALAFATNWVARFGIPSEVTSDRGAQFTSQLWKDLMTLMGTTASRTTSYHPQANGIVERFHRNLKDALRAGLKGPNWITELPWVLLGIRTAPKEDLGTSSAELVYGSPIAVPGDFLPTSSEDQSHRNVLERLRKRVEVLRPIPTSAHGSKESHVPRDLQTCKFVFIRRDAKQAPLQPLYSGPYEVVERGGKTFKLQIGSGQDRVSLDRLKPAHGHILEPASPPRRGRPPQSRSGGSSVAVPLQQKKEI